MWSPLLQHLGHVGGQLGCPRTATVPVIKELSGVDLARLLQRLTGQGDADDLDDLEG